MTTKSLVEKLHTIEQSSDHIKHYASQAMRDAIEDARKESSLLNAVLKDETTISEVAQQVHDELQSIFPRFYVGKQLPFSANYSQRVEHLKGLIPEQHIRSLENPRDGLLASAVVFSPLAIGSIVQGGGDYLVSGNPTWALGLMTAFLLGVGLFGPTSFAKA